MTIAFRDHEGFQRAAWTMAAAGAAAGLAVHVVSGVVSGVGSGALPPALLGGAVGAGLGAALAARDRTPAWLGATLMILAAGGAGAALVPGWAGIAILAVATAIAMYVQAPPGRLITGAALGGAVLLAAALVGLRIAGAEETAALPAWLVSALGGAATSFVAVAALVPRHVVIERDPVAAAVAGLPPGIDGEIRDLVGRGRGVWTEVEVRLGGDGESKALVRDGVLRLIEVARRSAALPVDMAASAAEIARRRADLDARFAAASDEVAAGQYQQALASLDEQERDLAAIRTGRERLVARMHNYLAGLERFRLAMVKHQASAASQLAAEARPLLGEVTELAADLDHADA
jgi:hypothetical protein